MSYASQLDTLLRAVQAGAVGGDDALAGLFDLREQRADNRQARRQAAQEAAMQGQTNLLGDLSGMAMTEAQQGTGLEDLLKMVSAQAGFSGTSLAPQFAGQFGSGLESLYVTDPDSKNYGFSRLSPSLDAEDAQAIADMAMQGETPDAIHALAQSTYGPKVYASIAPEIDDLINKAMQRGY